MSKPNDKPAEVKPAEDKKAVRLSTNKDGRASPAPVVHKEAVRALNPGIADAIVDIRVSQTEAHENDLSRNGYVQLLQEDAKLAKSKKANIASSTFGNRSSLWTWSRAQGTCSGRLKPVVDIQLDPSPTNSDLVLSGYLCDPVMISGQHLWIRRAVNEEEEKDAIVDLYVTTGKMKDTSDPVWSSPGVGWIRVDGNFSKSMFGGVDSILWFRPARTRSLETHMTSPSHSSVGLSEEIRLTKIFAATRLGLRNFVPVTEIKRLSNLILEASSPNGSTNAASTNIVRSERMQDFSSLYHKYAVKGRLLHARLTKMLVDTGINLSSKDVQQVFNYFDSNHNGFITIEEYTKTLTLTDFELDLAVERIRVKLLSTSSSATSANGSLVRAASRISAGVSKSSVGVIGAGSITAHGNVGRNKIRENLTMINVFSMINAKNDNILSIDEIMDLAAKTEQFFTEEEAGKFLKMMDLDGDDRVEEGDFVQFMRKDSTSITRKAFRVRESAAMLRRWLVRGTSEKMTAASTATASKQQWKDFKTKFEKSTGQKFPGYLSVQVLITTLASLGVRLSAIEARELTLLMAPEKNGRIHQSDLHSFMGRTCRSFGELIALLERDILKDLFDAYRAYSAALKSSGKEDPDLADNFRKKLDRVKSGVEIVFNKPPPPVEAKDPLDDEDKELAPAPAPVPAVPDARYKKTTHDVISVSQLKAGIEDVFKDCGISEGAFPNLEEWAALSVLVDADVAEGDIYGVKLKAFLEGLCVYEVNTADDFKIRSGEKVSLDIVSRELKRQIFTEARANGRAKKPDYKSVFDLFDIDRNGAIGLEEFRSMLKKLQLIPSLGDHQIPTLLGMFDKSKKSVILLDDFIAFAEDYARTAGDTAADEFGGALDADDGGELDEEEDDDLEGLTSNVPPVKVTRNADCDWLIWFLYRQACKVEPTDPESVITDLESACSETELIVRNQASISMKEFWNILFEKGLQGQMTKAQYVKGMQFVCSEGSGRDDDRVDYETICRSTVRMGRAFNEIVQERAKADRGRFVPLVLELKKYFKDLSEEKPVDKADRSGHVMPRYEKVFRRLDVDGDGMLTMREFKVGLRKLHYKDEKAWTMRIIRRLFDECDRNRDGLLSIKEFNNYILDQQGPSKYEIARGITQHDDRPGGGASRGEGRDKRVKAQEDKLNLSDDEEDEVFRKHRVLTDHELIRKVNEILHDVVPVEENAKTKHTETVKASVRRFFQRSDTEHRGFVSEERFRAFLRRTTLQDGLTTSELRRLTDKLKTKRSGGGGLKDKSDEAINYEKLLQMLSYSVETIPKSKAEIVFARFQDAAIASANAGRPFLSLCSLVDLRLSGKISRDELMVTAKMMDCPLSHYDVEAMLEMFPNEIESRDGLIDYRLIQNLLQTYSPRVSAANQPIADLDRRGRHGALPAYSSPHHTLHVNPNDVNGSRWMNKSINTPLGGSLTTPFQAYNDSLSNRPGGIGLSNTSRNLFPGRASVNILGSPAGGAGGGGGFQVYERTVKLIVERIKLAVEEQSRVYNTPINLRRQLEIYDNDNSGLILTRALQAVLDDIGISLSASDLHAVYQVYGRPEDDKLYYESLCRAVESAYPLAPGALAFDNGPRLESSGTGGMEKFVPYLTPKVMLRLRELKAEGRDPRDVFQSADVERDGLIPTHKFKEVIVKLQLLQTEHQLAKAMEDFSSLNNRSFVMYDDFCTALERSLAAAGKGDSRRGRQSVVNGSGYDGFRSGRRGSDESLLGGDYADEPASVYDSLNRFKFDNTFSPARPALRDYPVELEDGSESLFNRLDPPKVDHSYSLSRPSAGIASPGRYGSRGIGSSSNNFGSSAVRMGSYDQLDSPRRSTSSIQAPRTSPSKVGSKMWGSHTPLAKKGNAPRVGDDKWCCVVCLYVENPIGRPTCVVCDSPNYNNNKDYQVKEQCTNCTYLNGQFAEECEMCGEPLSNKSRKSKSDAGSASQRDRYASSSVPSANSRYSRDSSW